jgi:hypothetical protein
MTLKIDLLWTSIGRYTLYRGFVHVLSLPISERINTYEEQ